MLSLSNTEETQKAENKESASGSGSLNDETTNEGIYKGQKSIYL